MKTNFWNVELSVARTIINWVKNNGIKVGIPTWMFTNCGDFQKVSEHRRLRDLKDKYLFDLFFQGNLLQFPYKYNHSDKCYYFKSSFVQWLKKKYKRMMK